MTGADMDEDSEGLEVVKEEMFSYSLDLVKELEKKVMKHIASEVEKVLVLLQKNRDALEKRQGDQHTFMDEVKDELDHL